MNEETLNLSIRKFLKMVGVKSQHQIEQAISQALANGKLSGKESLPATMTLRIDKIGLNINFDGDVDLD